MAEAAPALAHLDAAIGAAARAPLSRRKTMLAALLLDEVVDHLFARSGATDILAFRAEIATRAPALALLLDLCAMRDDGPRLVLEPVEVPVADYAGLDVQDFMVSLYNGHTVQRVLIAAPDGSRHDAQITLAAARAALGPAIHSPLVPM